MMKGRMKKTLALGAVMLMGMAAFLVLAVPASATDMEYVTPLPPLVEPRTVAAVTIGDDQMIYVMGGKSDDPYGGGTILDTTIIYDPATGTSTYGPKMPTGVDYAASAKGSDGKIYVFGGSNVSALSITQIYDPVAKTWDTGASMPSADYLGAATAGPNGTMYMTGMVNNPDRMLIYNPVANSWKTGAVRPHSNYGAGVVAFNSTAIFAIAGYGGGASVSVDIYNPVTDTWSAAGDLNTGRVWPGATLAKNGEIYVMGGTQSLNVGGAPISSIEKYDAETDLWTTISSSLPVSTSYLGVVSDSIGHIFAVGGTEAGAVASDSVAMIDPVDVIQDRVIFTSPTNGSTVTGVVTVTIQQINMSAPINVIELYVDGQLKETQQSVIFFVPVSFQWDTRALADGSQHTLTVKAYTLVPTIMTTSITVTVATNTDRQLIKDLEGQISDLQAQLTKAQNQIDDLNESQAQNITALKDQITALQNQLNSLQGTTGNVKDSAASANLFAMIGMIVAIIVLVLVIINIMMSRSKK